MASLPIVDEREVPREPVRLPATVRKLDSHAVAATVRNLSIRGCGIFDCGLAKGDEIWIHIHGFQPVRATVIWARGSRAGCLFYATPEKDDYGPTTGAVFT